MHIRLRHDFHAGRYTNISRTERRDRQGMPRNRVALMAGLMCLAAADIGQVAWGYPVCQGSAGWELNRLLSAVEFVGSPKMMICPRQKVGLLSAQTRANSQEADMATLRWEK